MSKIYLILISMIFLSCAGFPERSEVVYDRDTTDKALLAWNAAAMTADMLQTSYIYKNDEFYEINPAINAVHDQIGSIGIPLYFVGAFGLRYLIADMLPSGWRKAFLTAGGVVSTGLVIHNNSIGIGFSF